MKCPKCNYISFDTPGRCRNCGYDFGMPAQEPPPVDGPLHDGDAGGGPLPDLSLQDERDRTSAPERARTSGIDLPLFNEPVPGLDDTPLISRPSAPRAPLAVRRATPDPSRLPKPGRNKGPAGPPSIAGPAPSHQLPAVPPAPPRAGPPLVRNGSHHGASSDIHDLLDLGETDTASAPLIRPDTSSDRRPQAPAALGQRADTESAPAWARLAALGADLGLLAVINVAVVHFTLSIVRYPWSRVGELPWLPLVTFCAMLDAGYFVLLTAASGQTLGKMLTGIRVVAANAGRVPVTQAALRAALAPLAVATLGLGYLPALAGRDRRALHDRLSNTRVIRA